MKSLKLLISIFCLVSGHLSIQLEAQAKDPLYSDSAFIDKSGKVKFKCKFETTCSDFSQEMSKIKIDKDDTEGFIDKSGNLAIKGFKRVESFREDLAPAGQYHKKGFIDKKGNYVIQPIFQAASNFKEGLAAVILNDKLGFIDKTGKIVIDPFYYNVASFSEGLAAAQADGKIGFLNKNGEWQIKPTYSFVYGFSEGLALVTDKNGESFIDKEGKTIIKLDPVQNQHRFAPDGITNSALRVSVDCWFSSKEGSGEFGNVTRFSDGLAAVYHDGKYGYMDKTGKFVIPAKYDLGYPFSDGLALVKVKDQYGYIDKSGSYVVEPKFTAAENFSEEAAAVATGKNKWGFIDTKGKYIISPKFVHADGFADGLARVQLEGENCDETHKHND